MVPFDCDALLPIEQRFVSQKFRRLSRFIYPRKLDWGDAAELVAFTQFLGGTKYATPIFGWGARSVYNVGKLLTYRELLEDAKPLLDQNLAQVQAEDGFAVLRALQQNGWKEGQLPVWVKQALMEEHHQTGITTREQAEKHGLSYNQVSYLRRTSPRGFGRADRSLVGLAFG